MVKKCLFYFTPEPYASVQVSYDIYKQKGNGLRKRSSKGVCISTAHVFKKPNPTLNICHKGTDGRRNANIDTGKDKRKICESCGTKGKTEWAHLLPNRDDLFAEMCIPCHRIYDFISNGA